MSILCAVFATLIASCSASAPAVLPGYVEGTYVQLGPQVAGRIAMVAVAAGNAVKAGDVLFTLDPRAAEIDVVAAKAALAEATALYGDRASGGSQDEIAAAKAVVDSLDAELANARADLGRANGLWKKAAIPKSQYDTANMAMNVAQSRLEAAKARLRQVKTGLRSDQLEALRQRMLLAQAQLDKAQWQLDQHVVTAPVSGTVDALLRQSGESAAPEAPVVSILTNDSDRIVFFPTGTERASLSPGDVVGVACTLCGDGMTATVTLVAAHAEFTPPQIYTTDRQDMLAYRVEARPDRDGGFLLPGMMVDLVLPAKDARP